MYEIGTVVNHPSKGVCKIDDMREEKFSGEKKMYYILHPLSEKNATVYVPVDSKKINLRKMLTKEEIISIISETDISIISWNSNANIRKVELSNYLKSEELSEVIALIATLHIRKEELQKIGKRLPATEERILHDAENKIYQEFSYVLDIRNDEVPAFIMQYLNLPIS